jgi:hypothetical protein
MNVLRVRAAVVVLAALLVVNLAACGGFQKAAQQNQRNNQLKQIGVMYINYHDVNMKGPSGPQDLRQFANDAPDAFAALQGGQFTIIWNVKMVEQKDGTSNTILGYEPSAPQSGGLVLFADGAVRTLSAQEFASAPKARPSTR